MFFVVYRPLSQSLASELTAGKLRAAACISSRIYKVQSSTRAANLLPKVEQKHSSSPFHCFFQLPSNCKLCFKRKHCQDCVECVCGVGVCQRGVSHGKDNALLEHAWFGFCRRMTLLGYYRSSYTPLNCSFVLPVQL